MFEKVKHPEWDENVKSTTSDRTSASGSNELLYEQLREEILRVDLLRQEIKEGSHDDREIADFVNELKDIAIEFSATQQLRDRISKCVNVFLDT